ncbi:MAG: hypothetical protein HY905_05510 [Deltaproteobacteria bacterium]|nr:hypothetical protein [Deltaproteobacteria bacterium]
MSRSPTCPMCGVCAALALLLALVVLVEGEGCNGNSGRDVPDACMADACASQCAADGSCNGGCVDGACRCGPCDAGGDAEGDADTDRPDVADVEDHAGEEVEADAEAGEDAADVWDAPPWDAPEGCCAESDAGGDCVGPADERLADRALGESWCFAPRIDNLTSQWYEPAPGCEQVTYESFLYGGMPAVWQIRDDGILTIGQEGVARTDRGCRCRKLLHGNCDGCPRAHQGRESGSWIVYEADDARPAGCAQQLVLFDAAAESKTILFDREPRFWDSMCDPQGFRYPLALIGTVGVFSVENGHDADGNYQFMTMDVLTGAEVDLTSASYPAGVSLHDAHSWDRYVIISGTGVRLVLLDAIAGTATDFTPAAPDPSCKYSADINDGTICWTDGSRLELCDLRMEAGNRILCSDLTGDPVWQASDDATEIVGRPSVSAEWVAWDVNLPSNDIRLHHRRLGTHYWLFDRTSGFHPAEIPGSGAANPRLQGDYIYFQVGGPDPVHAQGNVYRCNLRVLFPEAYE